MKMELREFNKDYRIHVYESGPDGKLALSSLFDFFQDIASEHAIALGYGRDELMKDNNFWVLSRMYSVIERWPSLGEKISIRTWPRGTEKLFALRDFIARTEDGIVIARATSSWLIIDYNTKRIQRPDDNLNKLNFVPASEAALSRNASRIGAPSSEAKLNREFSVRISDLDVNLHANNARYLEWVTDCYDLDFIMNNAPVSAEINYLAESHFNDRVAIMIAGQEGNERISDHSIVRTDDDTELCRVRIQWSEKQA
jgi:acyl-ACP thioesterase